MPVERSPLSSENEGDTLSPNRLSKCISFCNLGATTLLAIAVAWLFIQTQVITYKVSLEQKRLNNLLTQIQDSQQAQLDDLSEQVQEDHDLTVQHMALTFVVLACLISAWHIVMHLKNLHQPPVQRKIVAILWMPPIYGVTSWLSLAFPVMEGYLAIVKDFYEAFLIYTFLSFLISVLGRGNREEAVRVLAKYADHLSRPLRCLSCFYHPHPSESPEAHANAVLIECQILAMQFVFIRPITSIVNFVVLTLSQPSATADGGDSGDGGYLTFFASPQFAIAMVNNISVFFAFMGLLKFYHAVRDELLWCKPLAKFLCIKAVVFLTFWQGLAVAIAVQSATGDPWETNSNENDARDRATSIQNVLICLEMLVFSVAHWCTFPPEEWEEDFRPRVYAKPGFAFKDFAEDVSVVFHSRRANRERRRNPQYVVTDIEKEERQDDCLVHEEQQDDRLGNEDLKLGDLA